MMGWPINIVKMCDDFRPVQKLKGRKVKFYEPKQEKKKKNKKKGKKEKKKKGRKGKKGKKTV